MYNLAIEDPALVFDYGRLNGVGIRFPDFAWFGVASNANELPRLPQGWALTDGSGLHDIGIVLDASYVPRPGYCPTYPSPCEYNHLRPLNRPALDPLIWPWAPAGSDDVVKALLGGTLVNWWWGAECNGHPCGGVRPSDTTVDAIVDPMSVWPSSEYFAPGYNQGFLVGPGANLRGTTPGYDLACVDLRGSDLTKWEGPTYAYWTNNFFSNRAGCTGPPQLPERWTIRNHRFFGPGKKLVGLDFHGWDLSSLDLEGADLSGANLTGAKLSNTKLTGAILSGANLTEADLTNTIITGSRISGAKLTGAKLDGLTSGRVTSPQTAPTLPASYKMVKGYITGPRVNLAAANLSGDILAGADLGYANLAGANLSHSVLTNVRITGANITGTHFTGANPVGASSGSLIGAPASLPSSPWKVTAGYLFGPGADLTGASLPGIQLTDYNLAGANLSKANLSGAALKSVNLARANLTGANFSNIDVPASVKLSGVNLKGANLSGTNLSKATLGEASSGGITSEHAPKALPTDWRFIGGYLVGPAANLLNAQLPSADLAKANLTGTNLTGAALSSANLTGANLSRTILPGAAMPSVKSGGVKGTPTSLPDRWNLRGGYLVGPAANLTDATLNGVDLSNSDLTGANLSGANLTGGTLAGVRSASITSSPLPTLPAGWKLINGYLVGSKAILNGARLANASLADMNLAEVNLSGANLGGANLQKADLSRSNLSDANLRNVDARGASLGGADLTHALLTNARLDNSNLKEAKLGAVAFAANFTGADLTGANLEEGRFAGAFLTNSTITGSTLQNTEFCLRPRSWADATTYLDAWRRSKDGGEELFCSKFDGTKSGGLKDKTGKVGSGMNLYGNTETNLKEVGVAIRNGYLIGPDVNLRGADLRGLRIATECNNHVSPPRCDGQIFGLDGKYHFNGMDLSGADLTGADLRNATIENVNVGGTNFSGANMEHLYTFHDKGNPILPDTLNYFGDAYKSWDQEWDAVSSPALKGKFWHFDHTSGALIGPGVELPEGQVALPSNIDGGIVYPVYGHQTEAFGSWAYVECSDGWRRPDGTLAAMMAALGEQLDEDLPTNLIEENWGCRDSHSYLGTPFQQRPVFRKWRVDSTSNYWPKRFKDLEFELKITNGNASSGWEALWSSLGG